MLGPSRWLHEISLPKRLGHHFGSGLTPLAKNTLPIQCWGTFDLKNINCPVFQTFQIYRTAGSGYIKTLKQLTGFPKEPVVI